MTEESRGESREHWRDFWSATARGEPHDVWYAIDETKMGYLRPYLPKSGRCLEVGCGAARLSRFLARLGYHAVGIDYEPAAIEVAARRAKDESLDVALLLGNAFALPFATGSFDVVLSTGLLEHFVEPMPIVAEMARVLKPGGLFYSDIVPKKFSLMRSLQALSPRRHEAWERRFSRTQIEAMLRRCRLSAKTVFAAGIFPPVLPVVGRSPAMARLQHRTAAAFGRLTRPLDGTRAAELLGLYYFACAVKPASAADHIPSNPTVAGTRRAA
jgi:SAM-dependent methyltransferase